MITIISVSSDEAAELSNMKMIQNIIRYTDFTLHIILYNSTTKSNKGGKKAVRLMSQPFCFLINEIPVVMKINIVRTYLKSSRKLP